MANGTDEYAGTGTGGDAGSIDPASLANSGDSNGTGSDGEFDPEIHVARDKRNADGSYTRKRGRKSGSGNGGSNTTARKAKGDLSGAVDSLSRTLIIFHMGIASATKAPEMELDKQEADLLANATANVLSEFDIRPDPKVEAIFGLITACGMVYGPRVYSIRKRREDESSVIDPQSAILDFPASHLRN